ncbi:MAG: class I adenylate-forming enzyme family protein [Acidimicrobiales bacterium]
MGQSSTVAPIYRDDPRLEALIGPGGPFEVETVKLDGVTVRSFIRAPRTIIDCFRSSRNHEDLVHIVFEEERLTFREVRRRSLSLARALRDAVGVEPGDRVTLAMRNLPEFVVGFWGAALVGAIVVPLNAWWTGPELAFAINDAGARAVIADEERLQRLTGDGGDVADLPVLIAVRTPDAEKYRSIAIDALTGGDPLGDDDLGVTGPDDPVTILYTSGTTGYPKGALGTSRSAIANLTNMAFMGARELALTGRPAPAPRQSASIATSPLFHIGGMAAIVGGAMSGSKMVLMRKWSVEEGLALARAENVTSLGGVPAVARQVLSHPGVGRLGLDIVTFPMGGAAVPPDLPKRAFSVFGHSVQILNGYGLTETTSAVVTNVGSEYASHPESVGRPNLTADIRIEGEDGRSLGPDQVGELCFRSPQVTKGYWNRPDDTRASFVDGWFHSGDLGYIDRDGFVYVVDRLKDMVIRGGENVYCAEVEAVLFEHPGISDVAVIGLPDERMGERVCAVVVPRAAALGLDDIRSFVVDRLAAFKCPEAMFAIDELPRTPTGKTDKRELRAVVADNEGMVSRSW